MNTQLSRRADQAPVIVTHHDPIHSFELLLRRMADDLRLRNYSPCTEAQYITHVIAIARHFDTPPQHLTLHQVRSYLLHLINVRQCSWSWWKQAVGALRFFYGITLGMVGIVPYLPFPKRESHLPVVLSQERWVRSSATCGN